MNHFMLPAGPRGEPESTRYGVLAVERLISACVRRGADSRFLEAKIFGGGHVQRIESMTNDVAQSNIRFALEFLDTKRIPVIASDLGGSVARAVYFFTDSGRVLLKRIPLNWSDRADSPRRLPAIPPEKPSEIKELFRVMAIPDDGEVTLF